MKYLPLILLVIFTACGGGGSSEEPQSLPNPVAALSISENFPVMDEEIEISYTCTNLPSSNYAVIFSKNYSVNGLRVSPESVLDGHSINYVTSGSSGGLQIIWGNHFFQISSLFDSMPSSAKVNFSPTEFSFGEYLVSGFCMNLTSGFKADMNLTFTVLPGNFDSEIFDYAEFQ